MIYITIIEIEEPEITDMKYNRLNLNPDFKTYDRRTRADFDALRADLCEVKTDHAAHVFGVVVALLALIAFTGAYIVA